ncbi:MAG: ComEC/Rec2 family competence protein [Methylocystaceae bacterium]
MHWRRRWLQMIMGLLLLWLAGCQSVSTSVPALPERPSAPVSINTGQLTIWMLDVGQGDCFLLKSPSGKYMLVDGGPGEQATDTLATLNQLGVKTLDVLLVSHVHEDHIGGLSTILAALPVKVTYLPAISTTTRAYEQLWLGLKQNKSQIGRAQAGDSLDWDNAVKVTVLGPVKAGYEELNDSSLVLRVEFAQTSFLFTGDMTRQAEDDLLAQRLIKPVTVLKVAHHGSNGSTSAALLAQATPVLALISVGKGNDYGHPGLRTLSRLQEFGTQIRRTDQDGSIRLVSDGQKVQVYNEKPAPAKVSLLLIGNKKSQVVHRSEADHLPNASNRISFTSLDEAMAAGYRLCSRCFPEGKGELP